jgi:hypothetical protein
LRDARPIEETSESPCSLTAFDPLSTASCKGFTLPYIQSLFDVAIANSLLPLNLFEEELTKPGQEVLTNRKTVVEGWEDLME